MVVELARQGTEEEQSRTNMLHRQKSSNCLVPRIDEVRRHVTDLRHALDANIGGGESWWI